MDCRIALSSSEGVAILVVEYVVGGDAHFRMVVDLLLRHQFQQGITALFERAALLPR
jgi:hypothetical protein